ncbi:hypothetical protein ACJX0J_008611, partial [Zea mays]
MQGIAFARIDDIPQVTQQEKEFLNFIMDPYLYICKDTHLVTEIAQKFYMKQFMRCIGRNKMEQGDPLSPILAKLANQISGGIPHLVEDGLSILQYADDTIIF